MTIQRIGKRPNAAPSAAMSSDCPAGTSQTTIETTMATARDTRPEIQAVTRNTPSITNNVISGSAAKTEDHPSELLTGSKTCSYIPSPSVALATTHTHRPAGVNRVGCARVT